MELPDLLFKGHIQKAYSGYLEIYRLGEADAVDCCNFSFLLNELGELELALEVCQVLLDFNRDTTTDYLLMGLTLWRLGETIKAVDVWRKAFKARTVPLGGVIPCLLILHYAAKKMEDRKLQRFCVVRLERCLLNNAPSWPFPLAQFVLGKLDKKTLFELSEADENLIDRRHCQAYFYTGNLELTEGRIDKAGLSYQQSTRCGMSSLLQIERYLASHELALIGERSD